MGVLTHSLYVGSSCELVFFVFITDQMWAHVHMLKMRERIGSRWREMPAVPRTHNRGDPSILHHVDTRKTTRR